MKPDPHEVEAFEVALQRAIDQNSEAMAKEKIDMSPIKLATGLLRYIVIIFGHKFFDDNHMRGYSIGGWVAYRYKSPQ